MQRFASLYESLDTTSSTSAKVDAMAHYFREVTPSDAAWALFFLTGRKILRLVGTSILREALQERSGLPAWLIEESYANVGDLAETIALLVPEGNNQRETISLQSWVEERLLSLKDQDPLTQKDRLIEWWSTLSSREIFVLNKLVTGAFRTGVSQTLVVKSLSRLSGLTEASIAHRLMGSWQPTAEFFTSLISTSEATKDPGVPYPFYLASALSEEASTLGEKEEWIVEWKWDGIRAQAIRRPGGVFLWSRGEELITERFPEVRDAIARLPQGTVLDGEILAFKDGVVQPFHDLQQRIGRKKLSPKILAEVPVTFMVFDLLEWNGEDWRERPLKERREKLEILLDGFPLPLQVSPKVNATNWDEFSVLRDTARDRRVEGLMLKRLQSPYGHGRRRGGWWKWKVDPFTMDAVLIYAQPGNGRRATLYTDYTFGIWKDQELVPIAKAYSGLSDKEILAMDRWIRAHTVEKFGPVRKVEPALVFELAFEAIALSSRHKSGLAVRFPRILRKRDDKKPHDADRIDKVKELLRAA